MASTGRAALASNPPSAPLPYAGLQLRIVAFILDLMVLVSFFMLFVAAAVLQVLLRSDFGAQSDIPNQVFVTAGLIVLTYALFVPLYFALLWSWRGQTMGMMAVHIKVAARGGARLSFRRALARTLALALSLLPLGLGLLSVLFDRENRALHDYLAGTIVLELP